LAAYTSFAAISSNLLFIIVPPRMKFVGELVACGVRGFTRLHGMRGLILLPCTLRGQKLLEKRKRKPIFTRK